MTKSCLPVFIFILLFASTAGAQGFQTIYPGLSGAELIDSVASHYRPNTVLDYANARDTLYARVLAIDDDSIRCIYSGHTLWLDPAQDPTQFIYLNGTTNGMNTEHAYPQAKGAADGNARSDMHHLYPTRIAVNEARGNLPYAEIPDAQTQKWFINNQVLTSVPTVNKNAYSEQKSDAFEPREAVKGNIARSIFYFYTMYRAQANLADPDFFELQRPTLCQWAQQDPADSAELRKTWRIAPYQEGKPNPYVVDCTLAFRCWCPDTPPNCLSSTDEPKQENTLLIWPNPASNTVYFRNSRYAPAWVRLYSAQGGFLHAQYAPTGEGELQVQHLRDGLYCIEIRETNGAAKRQMLLVHHMD